MKSARHRELDPLICPLSGTNLIEASAGTGKTYTISSLVVRLLLEKGLDISQILIVTFTQAATEELKDRVRAKLMQALAVFSGKEERDPFIKALSTGFKQWEAARNCLRSALRNFDEAAIFTIHGFCNRVLSDHAFETGQILGTKLITDENKIHETVAQDFWRCHLYNAPPEFITYALSNKFKPAVIKALLSEVIRWSEVQILPQLEPQRFPELARFREKFAELRDKWPLWKDEVKDILLRADLDGRRYGVKNKSGSGTSGREKKIAVFMQDLDVWLARQWASFPPPKNLYNFASNILGNSTKGKAEKVEHPAFDLVQQVYELAKDVAAQMDQYLLYLKTNFAGTVHERVVEEKRRRNVRGYQDLILGVKKALEGPKRRKLIASLRKRFKAALIDEFHDTDSAQYFIFRSVFGGKSRPLFLIGDPKQAIYGFRGADIFAYLNATSEVDHRYTLSTNWRAEPGLVKAVNVFFGLKRRPFLFEEIRFVEAAPSKDRNVPRLKVDGKYEHPLKLWFLQKDPASPTVGSVNKTSARNILAQCVGNEIARLVRLGRQGRAKLGEEPIAERHMAVLVRRNEEAFIIQKCLRNLGINCVLYSGESVLKTYEAWEIQQIMAAIASPEDTHAVRVALGTQIFGLTAQDILGLEENSSAWEQMVYHLREYRHIWESSGFITMFYCLLEKEKTLEKLLRRSDGERRISNLIQLAELLQKASNEHNLGINGLLAWLVREIESDGASSEEYQLRLESDEDAVKVLTIHKSKGLEFPVVFCPFAWGDSSQPGDKALFHSTDDNTTLVLDLGSTDKARYAALCAREALAENIRLLYVAVTRAKSACYLAWGNINKTDTSAFAYLLCGPDSFTDTDVVAQTKDCFKETCAKGLRSSVMRLATQSRGTIQVCQPPFQAEPVPPKEEEPWEFRAREFRGRISSEWGISSFSSLISSYEEAFDLPEHDVLAYGGDLPEPEPWGHGAIRYESILEFPRGPKAGTFLHKVMEEVDFTTFHNDECKGLVVTRLQEYGYEPQWVNAIFKMMENTLQARLDEDDTQLRLCLIPMSHRINELEFYFPLRRISPGDLSNMFRGEALSAGFNKIPKTMEALQFCPVEGFMKGFIDMVFYWNERYYLVDWKSNFLGSTVEDYDKGAMEEEMIRHFYVLQYHIYSLALDQYLRLRVPGYSYDKHFGGVFYVFLRGMDQHKSPDYGVYKARPSKDMIRRLRGGLMQKPKSQG